MRRVTLVCALVAGMSFAASAVCARQMNDGDAATSRVRSVGVLQDEDWSGLGGVADEFSDGQGQSSQAPGSAAGSPATSQGDGKTSQPGQPNSPEAKTIDPVDPNDQTGKQPKRILWIIPNYRAVSANATLPPQTLKQKFWLATQDSFDYSNFIFVGLLSGVSMAEVSQPDFRQGAAGYGRYYWHIFVDTTDGNFMTEAIVPSLTREDPRYYTLGHGGFFKRTGYAISRLVITRTDGGHATFNFSEIAGNGAAAGIANTYYHHQANPWVKTYQRWGTQVGLDGIFNVFKEFWPDLNKAIFHQKY
jgi:hypothetical protein